VVVTLHRFLTFCLFFSLLTSQQVARQVAERTWENFTQAIIHALEERLERIKGSKRASDLFEEIMRISKRWSAFQVLILALLKRPWAIMKEAFEAKW